MMRHRGEFECHSISVSSLLALWATVSLSARLGHGRRGERWPSETVLWLEIERGPNERDLSRDPCKEPPTQRRGPPIRRPGGVVSHYVKIIEMTGILHPMYNIPTFKENSKQGGDMSIEIFPYLLSS